MCRERVTVTGPGPRWAVGYYRTAATSPQRATYWRAVISGWGQRHGYTLATIAGDASPADTAHPGPGLTAVTDVAELPAVGVIILPTIYHLSPVPAVIDRHYRRLTARATIAVIAGPSIVDIRALIDGPPCPTVKLWAL